MQFTIIPDSIKQDYPGQDLLAVYSRDEKIAQEALRLEKEFLPQALTRAPDEHLARYKENTLRLAELYGYPPCCARSYIQVTGKALLNAITRGLPTSFPNLILHSALQTRDPLHIPCILNNILLEHSIISHFPCSYECEKSKTLARHYLSILCGQDPDQARRTLSILATPLLVWDEERYATFTGRLDQEVLTYTACAPRGMAPATLARITRANQMLTSKDAILLIDKNMNVELLERDDPGAPLLLNFTRGLPLLQDEQSPKIKKKLL